MRHLIHSTCSCLFAQKRYNKQCSVALFTNTELYFVCFSTFIAVSFAIWLAFLPITRVIDSTLTMENNKCISSWFLVCLADTFPASPLSTSSFSISKRLRRAGRQFIVRFLFAILHIQGASCWALLLATARNKSRNHNRDLWMLFLLLRPLLLLFMMLLVVGLVSAVLQTFLWCLCSIYERCARAKGAVRCGAVRVLVEVEQPPILRAGHKIGIICNRW